MSAAVSHPADRARAPRLGFIGVGWIGLHRLKAVARSGVADVVCLADVAKPAALRAVQELRPHVPDVFCVEDFDAMFESDLDGVVIATPSGLHARQAIAALERGLAVFCQKPLARTAMESEDVVAAARRNNRLLDVDFCYRNVAGVPQLARLVRDGALGQVYAVDLTFHNAYGPDKAWFYDPLQSGGGCVMDLGVHLVDLATWVLDYPAATQVSSRLYAGGQLLRKPAEALEDYAVADIQFANGCTARLACSWRLPAGRDAVIEAIFYGTRGAASLRNVNGSFYDFIVEHHEGTCSRTLSRPPDEWGGRTICTWIERLAITGGVFDPAAERLVDVSRLIDAVYGR